MRKLLVVVLLLAFAERSFAVDVESGFLFGTMRFDGGRPENSGRKFSVGFMTDLIWRGEVDTILGFEFKTIGEPTDCKFQILDDVSTASLKFRYKLNPDDKTVYSPFLGIEAQQWKRNSFPEEELWGDLFFGEALFGLGLERDNFYFEVGGLWPFWTHVDQGPAPDGELGFMFSGGIIQKEKLKLKLFYRRDKLEDSKLSWFGLSAVYMF